MYIKDEQKDYSIQFDEPQVLEPYKLKVGQDVVALYGGKVSLDAIRREETFNRKDYPFMEVLGDSWDCGHLLGKQIGGIPDVSNFLPMTHKSNMEFLANMEDKVAKVISCFPAISLKLSTVHYMFSTKLKYEVNVIPGYLTSVRLFKLPKTINARLSIIDYNDREINHSLVNDLQSLIDLEIRLPLSLKLDVDK